MPQPQAYRPRGNYDPENYDCGCLMFVGMLLVLGGIVLFVLAKAYALI
jgi:hypothetical protein